MKRLFWAGGALLAGALITVGLAAPRPFSAPDRIVPSSPPPQPDAPHVVAFGTSLTAGQRWPDALSERLTRCLDRPVRVSVLARAGAGSDWALTEIAALKALAPDLVVMEFAINDADLFDGLTLAQSAENHRQMLGALAGLPVVMMSTNPVEGLQRLKRPRLARYFGLYPELSTEFDVTFLNLTARWAAAVRRLGPLPDGLHPTLDQAAAIYPETLAPVIGDMLFGAGACGPSPDR